MTPRIDYTFHAKELFEQYLKLDAMAKLDLPKELACIVILRASQLNGCAFCVDLHIKEGKKVGVDGLKLHHISIWRESPLFDENEKAALCWVENLTKDLDSGVSDKTYQAVLSAYGEKVLSQLTFLVAIINGWNRLGVAFQNTPGSADKAFGLDDVRF